MLKTRIKRKAAEAERAVRSLAEITASIIALRDDDLLDLADIFEGNAPTILGTIASTEVQRRDLTS
ncbi:hypothetical protein [Sphingomonas sp. M1A8_2b]